MAPRSRTPYAILGCLTVSPMSGYDVRRFMQRSIDHFWSESPGQIYPALRQLEEERLIAGRTEPGERGQEKRVYRITGAGRETLQRWLGEPAEPATPRYEHSLKLFFGHNVGPDVSLQHIVAVRSQTEQGLAWFQEREKVLEARAESEPDSPAPYWLVVLRGGIMYSEMVLAWCDATEKLLRSLPEPRASGGPDAASQPDKEGERC